jgi:hypothetical protein
MSFFHARQIFFGNIVLGATLLICPSGAFAQHGGGGGHMGGATAGGGGLSGGSGTGAGVDTKDDLRTFHEIMAVQASKEQIAAYATVLQSTASAESALKALQEQAGKPNDPASLAGLDKTFADAMEGARTLSKKFLEGFSEPQKNGLKEVTKRLVKTDSEVGQQTKAVDQVVEANAGGPQITTFAQNLERALTSFERAQVDLGEEMSIPDATIRQEFTFNLTPVKNSVTVSNRAFDITTSGVISKGKSGQDGQNTFAVSLSENLSDLQLNIADLLRSQLNKSERCGEQIAIQTAQLTPQSAVGLVVMQLHYERWSCGTMFGHDSANEIAEGNGTMEVKLAPTVAEDGTLQLTARIGRVDAEGLIGDALRSGPLGANIRDQIATSILSVMRQAGDFKTSLPAGARSYATLQRAQFQGTGSGKLMVSLDGEIRVSNDQMTALTGELSRASQQEPVPGPLLTRPPAAQESVSR